MDGGSLVWIGTGQGEHHVVAVYDIQSQNHIVTLKQSLHPLGVWCLSCPERNIAGGAFPNSPQGGRRLADGANGIPCTAQDRAGYSSDARMNSDSPAVSVASPSMLPQYGCSNPGVVHRRFPV